MARRGRSRGPSARDRAEVAAGKGSSRDRAEVGRNRARPYPKRTRRSHHAKHMKKR